MNITNLINQFIFWLRARPLINLLLILTYFITVLLLHEPLAQLSLDYEKQISLGAYNQLVEAVYVVFLLLLIAIVGFFIKKNTGNTGFKLSYLALTLLCIIIHSQFMFDSKIEVIHSFEFTFLAFLIFPLFNRFGAAIFFTLPFMLFDEWYQYTIIYPYLDYLDLNDIMMDTYGCGLAMTVLMIIGIKGAADVKPFWQRKEFIFLLSGVVLILLAVKFCFIAPYGSNPCQNTLLVINEGTGPEPFLRLHPTHHTWFHVMKPFEALVAITTVHLFYFGLDSFRK